MAERRWTDEQLSAIDTRDKTLLVSAAAGSGKTATLTERIIRSLTDEKNPIDIDSLLVVTFTNAAAGELRAKISKALTEKNIDILSLNTRLSKQGIVTMATSFEITSREELNHVIEKIRNIESVIDIERTTG